MKIKLEVSPDTEVTVEMGADNKPRSITLTPFFATAKGAATLMYGNVLSDNAKPLDRFVLAVSPLNGQVTKKSRSKPIKPFADLTDEERADLAVLAEDEVDDEEDEDVDDREPQARK